MFTEQRYEMILELLDKKGSITVTEVIELLNISESTARRDIAALHKAGKLTRVFGGAVALEHTVIPYELTVEQKQNVNWPQKQKIAAYAASLLDPGEFIYLDAGTTTGCMLEHLQDKDITVVTNAVAHAKRLASMGVHVLLVGGELKSSTEAVIGSQAIQMLKNYHFTKGFFGTNGITKKAGFTTPDMNEALTKEVAMGQCRQCYVLADKDKFDQVSSVTFGSFYRGTILTDSVIEHYAGCSNIIVCDEIK